MKKLKRNSKKASNKKRISSEMFLDKLLDFSSFNDTDYDCVFKMKFKGKEKFISVISISGIDIFHYTKNDIQSVFDNFAKATKAIRLPHKYVFTNTSPRFTQQLDFLRYKLSKTNHSYTKAMLNKKISELELFEKNHTDRMAYLMLFGENATETYEATHRFFKDMSDVNTAILDSVSTVDFLNKYLCFNAETDKVNKFSNINDRVLPDEIKFQQNCFCIKNKTYATSLVVYNYPAYISDLELANLVSTYSDTLITFDVTLKQKKFVIDEISNSLKELESRGYVKQEATERHDTDVEYQKLMQIYSDLSQGREQMFYTTLRFLICADSIEELSKKTMDISEELEGRGLGCFVPMNQMKEEYLGLVTENNTIQTPYPLYDSLASQFPFYYQAHCDPKGMFFGYTDTGGLNVLNTFYRNTSIGRNSYDCLITGLKGGGKSATLRAMIEDQLILGNKVMVLDIESEYNEIAKMYEGQIIKMNQRSNINPLQIQMTIDVDSENIDSDEDEMIDYSDALAVNFTSEISRICTFMYQFAPNITAEQISDFQDILIDVFKEKGITKNTDVSKLSARDFPLFSDVYEYIHKKAENSTDFQKEALKKLETQIKPLTRYGAYGTMFDNYTNVNVNDSNLVVFNVQSISELDVHVYNACMFNILSIMWAEICKNRSKNKNVINEYDRRNVVCLIDEAHRFISTKYPQVIEFIEKLLRRTRKYDAALWFASQSIIDFMSTDNSEEAKTIKVLFQLVQYKFIMLQDNESIPMLKEVFGQFTMSELQSSTSFAAGEMLMSLSSGRNKIHCRRQITTSSMLYCGNSQDRLEIVHRIFNELYNQLTYAEYGKKLMNNPQMKQQFINVFTSEVLDYMGFKQTDSEYLTQIVTQMCSKMCSELIEAAKENV